jgi:hypothetical protein
MVATFRTDWIEEMVAAAVVVPHGRLDDDADAIA